MFGLTRWLSNMGLLHETPGDGGGGGAWPDYDVPEGVGDTDAAPAGGQPAAAAPAAAAAAPAGGGQPPADGGDRRAEGQPGTGGQPGGRQGLPQYRQDQQREAFERRVDEQVKAQIKSMFSSILGGNEPAEDPRMARVREGLFKAMPELKTLLEKIGPKTDALASLADDAPRWGAQNKAYWGGVAARTTSAVHDGVAKALLGDGKSGKDLDPELAEDVREAFIKWIERDNTGGRVDRYEAQDANLVSEFLQAWSARYIDPARRLAAVSVADRGQRLQRLPVQGSGGTPPAAAPPKVDLNDEEAVHGQGWKVMQELRGGR